MLYKKNLAHATGFIESSISMESVSQSPRLVAVLGYYGSIPLIELISNPKINTKRIKYEEGLEACYESSVVSKFFTPDPYPTIFLSYRVYPWILIIKDLRGNNVFERLKIFISRLHGNTNFKVIQKKEISQYIVTFDNQDQCITVWRALDFVPFNGKYLNTKIFTEPFTAETTPAHKLSQSQRQRSNSGNIRRQASSRINQQTTTPILHIEKNKKSSPTISKDHKLMSVISKQNNNILCSE